MCYSTCGHLLHRDTITKEDDTVSYSYCIILEVPAITDDDDDDDFLGNNNIRTRYDKCPSR